MIMSPLTVFLFAFAALAASLVILRYASIADEKLIIWLLCGTQENKDPTEADKKYFKCENIKVQIYTWGGLVGFALSSLSLIAVSIIIGVAKIHGLPNDEIKTTSNIISMITGIVHTPVESSVKPEDIKSGDIIIYYRFGCKDCEAVYKDLKNSLADVSDVYWISTRSETGKALLKTYPVTEVPSGVYVRKTGNTSFNKFLLYIADGDNIRLNDNPDYGLPRLLYLKNNDL